MNYVVLALYSLDKSVPLVSSDRLAATYWLIHCRLGDFTHSWSSGIALHSQIGDGRHAKLHKQLRLIQLPQIPSVHCVGPAQSLGAI